MTEFSKFDSDPEALAWARGRVERIRDKFRRWESEANAQGNTEAALRCRWVAVTLERDLIGGEGCTVAAFDPRMPTVATALTFGVEVY